MSIRIAFFVAATLAAGAASAADEGFYVGGGLGVSNYSVNKQAAANRIDANLPAGLAVGSAHEDQRATPFEFYVGYRFMPYFATELGYMDNGSSRYQGQVFDTETLAQAGTVKGTRSVTGWPLSALGIWPINDTFDVFARGGAFFASTRFHYTALDMQGGSLAKDNVTQSSTEWIWGLGADAKFMDHFGARVEWQAVPSLGGSKTGNGDFNAWLFSVNYRF